MLKMEYVSLKRQCNLWEKADFFKLSLLELLTPEDMKSITSIFVEENLQVFRRGLSSARTLMTLAKFNGIVCYILRQIFEIDPISINVNEARRSVGLKIISQRKGGSPTKEQVIDWVAAELSGTSFVWPTKVLKSGPRRGQTIMLPECGDMADAYVISRAAVSLYT